MILRRAVDGDGDVGFEAREELCDFRCNECAIGDDIKAQFNATATAAAAKARVELIAKSAERGSNAQPVGETPTQPKRNEKHAWPGTASHTRAGCSAP